FIATALYFEQDGPTVSFGGENVNVLLMAGATRVIGIRDADFAFVFGEAGFYGAMREAVVDGPKFEGFVLTGTAALEINTTGEAQTVTLGGNAVQLSDGGGAVYLRVELSETPEGLATLAIGGVFAVSVSRMELIVDGPSVSILIANASMTIGDLADPIFSFTVPSEFKVTVGPDGVGIDGFNVDLAGIFRSGSGDLAPQGAMSPASTSALDGILEVEGLAVTIDGFNFSFTDLSLSGTFTVEATSAKLFPNMNGGRGLASATTYTDPVSGETTPGLYASLNTVVGSLEWRTGFVEAEISGVFYVTVTDAEINLGSVDADAPLFRFAEVTAEFLPLAGI